MRRKTGTAILAAVALLLAGCQGSPARLPDTGSEPAVSTTVGTTAQSRTPDKPAAYRAIYDKLGMLIKEPDGALYDDADGALYGGAPTRATSAKAAEAAPAHSGTNIQVEGVQEADVIKTDGRYIYLVSTENLLIVQAEDGQARIVSRIPLRSEEPIGGTVFTGQIQELYIADDRLVLIRQSYEETEPAAGGGMGTVAGDCIRYGGASLTEALFYDVSDRAHPRLTATLGQRGSYLSSRMVGNYLYIASSYYPYGKRDAEKPGTFVPSLLADGALSPIPAGSVYVPDAPASAQYLVITGADAANPSRHVSSQAMLDGGGTLYAGLDSLYIAASHSAAIPGGWETITRLTRFSTEKGVVRRRAAGQVEGRILNQFSMDEYGGYFRIVTTCDRWQEYTNGKPAAGFQAKEGNNLFVLDAGLKTVGKIEKLAPGERIYSVRFDGETGYFVTFRQVDPLFTVSLRDPAAPAVQSQLKIPGFSEYLHVWNEDLLFGLGKDADESTGRANGLKLSMFQVSDPQNVVEQDKTLLGAAYPYTEASYNHKAVLIDVQKNLIAFSVANAQGRQSYLVYAYDAEKGFIRRGELKPAYQDYPAWMRGLYIGDFLYLVTPDGLTAYRLADLQQTARLTLE